MAAQYSPIPGADPQMWSFNVFNHQGALVKWFTNTGHSNHPSPLISGINDPYFGPIGEAKSWLSAADDATTPILGGAKIFSVAHNIVVFDTAHISDLALISMACAMCENSTGDRFLPKLTTRPCKIDGVRRTRLTMRFFRETHTAGRPDDYDLSNIGPGEQVVVQCFGFMPPYVA